MAKSYCSLILIGLCRKMAITLYRNNQPLNLKTKIKNMKTNLTFQTFLSILCCCLSMGWQQQAQAQQSLYTPDAFLCSVTGTPVSYNLGAAIDGVYSSLILSTSALYGTGTLDSSGMFVYVPNGSASQTIDNITYSACNASGFCSFGTIYITLADMESLPQPTIEYHYYEVSYPNTTDICHGNMGWNWQHNGEPNLFMVTVSNNTAIGQLSYINDNCVLYTPNGIGTDTIRVVGCGDAPPPTFLTCNGWEQMNTCSHTYYVVNVSNASSSFTENHTINCDSTLLIGGLGYPSWVVPTIIDAPNNGTATIVSSDLLSSLSYTPAPNFEGTDTVVVECAHATQITCETGIYIFTVTCDGINYHFSQNAATACHETIYIELGGGITPIIEEYPEHGIASILYGDFANMLIYMPFGDFNGLDQVGIACATTNTSGECQNGLYKINVICEPGAGNNVITHQITCDSTFVSNYMAGGWGTPPIILQYPQHGTATIQADHYVAYTPNAGYTGMDTIWINCTASGPADGCLSELHIFEVECSDAVQNTLLGKAIKINYVPQQAQIRVLISNNISLKGNIELIDIAGRIAGQAKLEANYANLSTQALPQGVYVVNIATTQGNVSSKIFIY
jgi:hypothetical protein